MSWYQDTFVPFWARRMKWDRHTLSDFVTSPLVAPKTLMALRFVFFLWILATDIGDYVESPPVVMIRYFTEQSFVLLGVYFLVSSFLTYKHVQSLASVQNNGQDLDMVEQGTKPMVGKDSADGDQNELLPVGYRFLWVLFEAVLVNAVMTDIVYWALLSGLSSNPGNYYNVAKHGLNMVALIVEVALNRLSVTNGHLPILIGYILLYTFFSWIWYAATNEWIYFFLNWLPSDTASIYYFGLLIGYCIFVQLARLILAVRDRLRPDPDASTSTPSS